MTATASAATGGSLRTDTWEALSSTVVMCLAGADAAAMRLARRALQRELEAIDRAASRFRPDSELSEVNRRAGSWVEISPLLWEAVSLGVRAASISRGAVDPTLGRELIDAGYDRDWQLLSPAPAGVGSRPSVARPRRAEPWRLIELTRHPPAVRIPHGVSLDLGATAKALTADRGVHAVNRVHPGGALVSLGGDLATAGQAPAGGWRVHVTDDHRHGDRSGGQTVTVLSGALATSSICVRRWLHNGEPAHHILDPRDGQPVRTPWRTASVAAESCADANIAATAAIVLGDAAPAWLAEHSLPARLVSVDGVAHVQGRWPR
jgi:thiamine biosynthesis lipoprotein